MEVRSDLIPHFVTASSPQGLRRVMLMNNAKHGKLFQYFDIQESKGKWYAWFYAEMRMNDPLIEGDSGSVPPIRNRE